MQPIRTLLALAFFGGAAAVCPNACSGHGTCGNDDVCYCYQDWGMGDEISGDCSMKYCPYEVSSAATFTTNPRFPKCTSESCLVLNPVSPHGVGSVVHRPNGTVTFITVTILVLPCTHSLVPPVRIR